MSLIADALASKGNALARGTRSLRHYHALQDDLERVGQVSDNFTSLTSFFRTFRRNQSEIKSIMSDIESKDTK